jgi:hypothetical protein
MGDECCGHFRECCLDRFPGIALMRCLVELPPTARLTGMSFRSTAATSTFGGVGSAAPAEVRPQFVKLKAIAATNRGILMSAILQWRFFFMGSYP